MARGFFACDAKETKETKKQQKSTEMTEIDRNRQKSTGAFVFLVFLASLRGALSPSLFVVDGISSSNARKVTKGG